MPGDAFADLRTKLAGTVVTPDDAGYDLARRGQLAKFHDQRPRAVVQVDTPEDIAETITFARQNGIALRPRSGGHCFAGRSSTDGIVLDVSSLNAVSVHGTATTIGAGARLAHIYDSLWHHGRTLNLGCGQTVGIAGLTLGGGLGLLGRAYGLTCDQLTAAELVLADGTITSADEDLFWALRGAGGGQFGVVTQLTFATIEDPRTTRFHLTWPYEAARDVIAGWQDWAPDSSDGMNANLRLIAGSDPERPPVLHLFGLHLGSKAETRRILDQAGPAPSTSEIDELVYQRAKPSLSGLGAEPATDEPRIERSRSEFFRTSLPTYTLAVLLDRFTEQRAHGVYRELNFTPWGGAYIRKNEGDTAFAHRNSRFLIEHLQHTPEGVDDDWANESWQVTHPYSDEGRVYPNFPDPDLDDPLTAYHGANLERLRTIKRRYDPDRFFDFPQGL